MPRASPTRDGGKLASLEISESLIEKGEFMPADDRWEQGDYVAGSVSAFSVSPVPLRALTPNARRPGDDQFRVDARMRCPRVSICRPGWWWKPPEDPDPRTQCRPRGAPDRLAGAPGMTGPMGRGA
jgi:hypothetical protein